MEVAEKQIQQYASYKPSGVEWLGDIPEHWQVTKLKYLIKSRTGYAFPSNKFKMPDSVGIPVVRISDLNINGEVKLDKCPKLPIKYSEFICNYGLKKNDILFAMTGGTIGKVAIYNSNIESLLNQRVCSFTIKNNILRKIIFFWMNSTFWKEYVNLNSSGGAQPNISDVDVLNLPIGLPPLQEQTKITQFLEDKTTKIDQAIAIKEEQIALLKERKQILIHKAVTCGLDDSVALKDSGAEWIGEIPEHWEVLPGFMVYKENKTKNVGMKEDVVLSLSYGNIIIKPKEKLVGLVPESFETYQIVKPGDIIVRCMDLQNDKTSLRTGIAINHGIITSAYLNLNIINDNVSEYVYNFLHSLDTTKVLYKFGTGLRQNLSFGDFKHLNMPVPPKDEQKAIVNYIEIIKQKIETAIGLKQQEIERLKEYKSSLINSCVTGKVKVC